MKDDFLEKKLHFVTGKGGVGKTTVTAWMANLAAQKKKKVLIVDLDPDSPLTQHFNGVSLSYQPIALADHIDAVCLHPKEALKEYLVRQLKFEKIYHWLFENKFVSFFLDVAPGLDEIAILGKLHYLDQEKNGKKNSKQPRWDIIIVDTPATGHSLYLFKSPKVFIELSQIGPIARHAQEIYDLLTSSQRTSIHLVSLLQELPVQETIELYSEIKAMHLPLGSLFINKQLPVLNSSMALPAMSPDLKIKLQGVIKNYEIQINSQSELKRNLEKNVPIPIIDVPKILR